MSIRIARSALRALAACAGLAALSGCIANPISLTAAPGSTVAVPVVGETFIGTASRAEFPVGYGVSSSTDPQRGSLRAVMCPEPSDNIDQCMNNSADRVFPSVRYVTRVFPDPASPVGIDNKVDGTPGYTGYIPVSGQVLAFVDIPDSLKSRFPTCSGSQAAPSCFSRLQYALYFYTVRPDGSEDRLTLGMYERPLYLVRGDGLPSPNDTFYAFGVDMTRYVPYPKVVYGLGVEGAGVYAAEVTLTIPSRIDVKDVIEEEHLGRHAIILWKRTSPTQVKVQMVDPQTNPNSMKLGRFALVFALNAGAASVTLNEFNETVNKIYDASGGQTGGAFHPIAIR